MAKTAVPLRRMVRHTTVFSLAPVLAIVALAALGRIDPATAAIAAVFTVAGIAAVLRRYLADLNAIVAYVEELTESGEAVRPRLRNRGTLPELAGAIGRLRQSWKRRSTEFARLARSTEVILENLPQPLILIDRDRRVVRATVAARELLGSDVAGRDLAALLRNPAVLDAAADVLAGGARADVEFTIQFPVERTFRAWVTPLPAAAADGTAAIIALYDLTEIKRSDQMRADFIANASHELRTPLSVLLGCIKTLRGSAVGDPEAQSRFLTMMEGHAERMTSLVQDLLSLSRIELNEHAVPSGRVDLAPLIRHVADSLEFPASARGMTVDVRAEPDLPPIAGDEAELAQLFRNLIDNAIKYGRRETVVRVAAGRAGERAPANMAGRESALAVSVSDEGEGIAPEHLPRLTERFYRVDTGRSREMGGTGLGLAIVKHIVSRHRGVLRIDSKVGKGSTFTVYLPAAKARKDDTHEAAVERTMAPADAPTEGTPDRGEAG